MSGWRSNLITLAAIGPLVFPLGMHGFFDPVQSNICSAGLGLSGALDEFCWFKDALTQSS